jgi:hypothetical protein
MGKLSDAILEKSVTKQSGKKLKIKTYRFLPVYTLTFYLIYISPRGGVGPDIISSFI